MDIPSEAIWIIVLLVALGVVLGVVTFLAFQGGSFRTLDLVLGFFR